MKKRDVDRLLSQMGYHLVGGGKHEKWENISGSYFVMVPRHKDIDEGLAKSILRKAAQRKDEQYVG